MTDHRPGSSPPGISLSSTQHWQGRRVRVLSRIVAVDGSAGSAVALMDELEREPEAHMR